MAIVNVAFMTAGRGDDQGPPFPDAYNVLSTEKFTLSGTSQPSAACPATESSYRQMYARVIGDGAFWAAVGTAPVAAAGASGGSLYCSAGVDWIFSVRPGDKVAVIQA